MKTGRGRRNGSSSWVPGTHTGDLRRVPGSWLPAHPSLHHRSYLGTKPVLSLTSFLYLWKKKVYFDTKIFKSMHTTSSQKFMEGLAVWGSGLKPRPTARTRTGTPMGCPCCRQRLLPLTRADQISLWSTLIFVLMVCKSANRVFMEMIQFVQGDTFKGKHE